MKVPVSEIFVGVQGEGIYSGVKTLFVRLSGCNLAIDGSPCKWCDTSYAWEPSEQDTWYEPEDLKEEVIMKHIVHGTNMVSFTGGEPMYYWPDLENALKFIGKRTNLLIETNGCTPIYKVSDIHYSMDIKCPSSGNADKNILENIAFLGEKDQLKCVIQDRQDYEFSMNIVEGYAVLTNIVFQPSWGKLELKELIEWVVRDKNAKYIRVCTQLHKLAYGADKRGV